MVQRDDGSLDSTLLTGDSKLDASAPDVVNSTLAAPTSEQEERSQADAHTVRLVAALDDYLNRLESGDAPEPEQFIAAHPDLAKPLKACLAGLDFIYQASNRESTQSPRSLGDFRIVREIGRGGMGAVYEAEQISLRRRVALKVLRFASLSDPEAVERFQREAETVARLHHTNIVPVYSVGSEQGVNYYAMQFIEGRSLDHVVRDCLQHREPLRIEAIARWGLQAAEALAHAHQRGVIHRDIKPSNLLIDDAEGRIWLTDFGLAKRLDDVTLSMTGALLGTPRYMSPEQASATCKTLDHRTDIYSWGATFYELTTGEPAFAADTPAKIISQILTQEPEPPRRIRPDLPRDLETILLKCLAKEADQRYGSAQELVNDLRAFLDHRSISARRPTLVERVKRWTKRQRRSVALTAASVLITLACVGILTAGIQLWDYSQLAFVRLKSAGPPLIAEWLQDEQRALPTVTVPTQNPLEVPSGQYQLRVSGAERLSQTFDLRLRAGEHFEQQINLDDGMLWTDVPFDRAYQPVVIKYRPAAGSNDEAGANEIGAPVPGDLWIESTDLICFTNEGLRCLAGVDASPRWQINLHQPTHPVLTDGVALVWPWDRFLTSTYARGQDIFDDRPFLVSAANGDHLQTMDFNSDGVSDLLLAIRNQAILVALSGSGGDPLWAIQRTPEAAVKPIGSVHWRTSSVIYPPRVVRDQDGDAIDDVLISFVALTQSQKPPRRWIELVSGATSETLWHFDLANEWFELPKGQSVPYQLRWFYGSGGGYSSQGGGFMLFDGYYVRNHSQLERSGTHEYLPTQPIVIEKAQDPADAPTVLVVAGDQPVHLDLKTGSVLQDKLSGGEDSKLAARPAIQPSFGDMNGDGRADLLLTEAVSGTGASIDQARLVAWSPARQQTLWKHSVRIPPPRQFERDLPLPKWPQLVDLDGDGVVEVICPTDTSEASSGRFSPPWGELSVLEGQTGKVRWRRRIFTMDQRLENFSAGPDVNHDGVGELMVATLWGADHSSGQMLFVDCLSGVNGQSVWRTRQPLSSLESSDAGLAIADLQWYGGGEQEWPHLVVALQKVRGEVADQTYLVDTGTGKVTHVALNATDLQPGDLDGDGVKDLMLSKRDRFRFWNEGGTLHAVRGAGDEAWRRLESLHLESIGDVDGDGISDLVTNRSSRDFEAFSGRSGSPLWSTQLPAGPSTDYTAIPARKQALDDTDDNTVLDLNGDKAGDLILLSQNGITRQERPLVCAMSGKTGRLLWQSEAACRVVVGSPWADCRDVDGDGEAEIIVVGACDFRSPDGEAFGTEDARLWVVILSGQDGRVQWAEPLTAEVGRSPGDRYRLGDAALQTSFADLNADNILDLLVPAQRSPGDLAVELRAVDGSNGSTLWKWPIPVNRQPDEAFSKISPAAVADVDADGMPEAVISRFDEVLNQDGQLESRLHVEVLDAYTGRLKSNWSTIALWRNSSAWKAGSDFFNWRPVLLSRSEGGCWIACRVQSRQQELHVIDGKGQPIATRELVANQDQNYDRLWKIDVEFDGNEELLLVDDAQLHLLKPDQLEQPLWSWAGSQSGLEKILTLVERRESFGDPKQQPRENPSRAVGRQAVIVRTLPPNASVGEIRVGENHLRWISPSPNAAASWPEDETVDLLNQPTPEIPPHLLYQSDSVIVVRRGMLTTKMRRTDAPVSRLAGKLRMPGDRRAESAWATFARAGSVLPESNLSIDLRLLRPLPWLPSQSEIGRMRTFSFWSVFYGVTLALIPLACLFATIRQRTWDLRGMLLWVVAAAIVLLGVSIDGPGSDFRTIGDKLSVAYLVAGPVLLISVMLVRGIWRQQFREVLRWCLIIAVTVLLVMVLLLFLTYWSETSRLLPGERYNWSGWYWILPPVLYLVAWALTLAAIAQSVFRGTQRWRKGIAGS